MAAASQQIAERRERAAEEFLACAKIAPGMFEVVNDTGDVYIVDARDRSCSCDDFRYRGERLGECKHLSRVLMELGAVDIPDVERVDPLLAGGYGGAR